MFQIEIHEPFAVCQALSLGEDVKMEMSAAARSLGHLLPRGAEDPSDEVARGLVVEGILRHPPGEEGDVVE